MKRLYFFLICLLYSVGAIGQTIPKFLMYTTTDGITFTPSTSSTALGATGVTPQPFIAYCISTSTPTPPYTYVTCPASAGGGVTQLIAGTNITLSPPTGLGAVTITASSTAATAFSAITAGTNATALLMGTGGSLGTSGTGTITATAMPAGGLTGQVAVANGGTGAATSAANSVFGNFTGGTAAPGFSVAPVFSAALLTGFPTFNQNTTGSAAKWTTARNLAGNSVDGSANVPFANAFIVQGAADAGLSGAQFLGALATGALCNTTTTGVLSICAVAPTSVSNSDGTLTISPTTGAVVASLALGHANTWTAAQTLASPIFTGTPDASGATQFKLPVAAAFVTAANGEIGYDTTNKNWHVWQNGVDSYTLGGPVSGTYTNGDCVKFGVAASVITLVDNGSACGSGGGTPAYPLTITGGVSGGVVYANSTTQLTVSPVLTANVLTKGGGAGAAPTNSSVTDNGTTVSTSEPLSVGASIATTADGVHPSYLTLVGNTTNPSLTASTFGLLGPTIASPTAYAWQVPTATNASAGLIHAAANSGGISALTISQVAIADLSATGTPSSTTFLRGDNTWATPAGTGTVTSVGFTGGLISVASATTTPAFTVAGTSGGVVCFTGAATWASSSALTSNVLTKGGGAGVCPTNSSITDSGTAVTTTDTGGYVAPVFVANGTTAGFIDFPQGTTSAAVAPCNTATSICFQAPTSVTSQLRVWAGAPATGTTFWTNSSGTMTETINPGISTATNCNSAASPAVCGSAAAGSVVIPTGTTSSTLTVNTSTVTANSQIIFYPDDSLGTRLSVTCNSTLATLAGGSFISARTPGTSFAITFNGSILTNGVCGSFVVVN
jgi:hypothetical protein